MSNDSLIDPAAIDRLREWGGDKLVRQMVRLYGENARVRLDQVDEGLAPGGNLERAEQGAHSLKSSAANVGAREVNRLAAELEEVCGNGDVSGAAGLRGRLHAAVAEAAVALDLLLAELPE